MRPTTFALLVFLSPVAIACEGRALTGPEAQRAAARAAPLLHSLPQETVVLLNGARLAPGQTLEGLKPATIASIEIVKAGDYPTTGERHPVIRISTTDSAFVERVTVH
jgi:hypothetical protein